MRPDRLNPKYRELSTSIAHYKIVRERLSKLLSNSTLEEEIGHANNTLKWLLILRPDADNSLKLAAEFHDIERSQPDRLQRNQFSTIQAYKNAHAQRGAEIARREAIKSGFTRSQADRLYLLIAQHESGGSYDADSIRDADSLSFFDYNFPFYLLRNTPEKTAEKVLFMYTRMSDRAKQLALTISKQHEALAQILQSTQK